ncbi:MAG: methyl-accepting chemotaxis protein, partial [Treponema sp.]|nr:methyl-accepting chemotaxis protein [Treponema sp.]
MKIGFKLVLIMIVLNVAGIGFLGTMLLFRSRANIMRLVEQNAVSIAEDTGKQLRVTLEVYLDTARAAAQMMTRYDDIVLENRRPLISAMLQGLARENPGIVGVWTVWEPDALDGMDAQYANTPGSDSAGRFTPYWYWENGELIFGVLTDYNDADYYQIPLKSGNEAVLEPFMYTVGSKDILMTSLAAPINVNGQTVGVVGIDFSLDSIQDKLMAIKPFGDGVTALFTQGGAIVAHFDPGRIGKNMTDTEQDMSGGHFEDLINAVREGKPFAWTIYDQKNKVTMDAYTAPFDIGKTKARWSLAVAVSEKNVLSPVYELIRISVVIVLITTAAVAAASVFFARTISRPIVETADMLRDISEGEGDLTKTINIRSKDEIGDLAKYFNQTLDKIKKLIIAIKKQSARLSDIGGELSTNMTETAAAINEIAATIQSIKTQVINQSAGVTETNATMEQITVNINKLNGHVEHQTDSVSQSSSAIEEMLASIQSVTNTLVKNAGGVEELIEASGVGRTGLLDVAADIQKIARESEGLLEINALMESIASQTNLLSMNAAIEAAHAGEAGKGFAVVAGEIRKLAENSGKQSKTIGAVLKKIKESIDKITKSTGNVLNRFEAIDSGVKTVADQEENIRNAMEEQAAGSKQVLEAISMVNEITQQVKSGSREMLEGSKEVIQESKNLERMTQEITQGMNEMAAGADQINIAVSRVNELSGQNRDNIDTLVQEVAR